MAHCSCGSVRPGRRMPYACSTRTRSPLPATRCSSSWIDSGAVATMDWIRSVSRNSAVMAAMRSPLVALRGTPSQSPIVLSGPAAIPARNSAIGGPSPSGLSQAYRTVGTRLSVASSVLSSPLSVRSARARSTAATASGSAAPSRRSSVDRSVGAGSAAIASATWTLGRTNRRNAATTLVGSDRRRASSANDDGAGVVTSGRRARMPERRASPSPRSHRASTWAH